MIKHFMHKCPVNYALVRPAICIDPPVMAGYPEKAQERMKKIVKSLAEKLELKLLELRCVPSSQSLQFFKERLEKQWSRN
ncbi:hypothetical protein AVEN_27796-1 [Araneus ventricosus]|uniref:Uncharacterized protein n=1 Tax=Araneus ventricosus TaxID=182803 RepID=A0A4Y2EJ57_ARAVE|nr:hypothetical protein AVEN_27796-1 [Araneus ventricosus]